MRSNHAGRGPSWSNSLFEDCAEFGMGFRLAVDQQIDYAAMLLNRLAGQLGDNMVAALMENRQETEEEIAKQRELVADLNQRLKAIGSDDAKNLLSSSDYLIRKSVWSFGGDGWAYDIGFGGLDHVLASGRDVNIWCSIPKCIRTPAGRPRNRPSAGRWPSSPPAANAAARRTWA